MAVASWPETLPFRPEGDGWTNSLGATPLRTDIEGPALEQRSRPGDDIETILWQRAITRAEFAAMRTFVTGTLRNGAVRFYMPVTLNRADYEVRAVKIEAGSFSAVGVDNARVRVSMSLQVFPAVWAPPAPAITGVSGATISGTAPDGATVRVEIAGTVLTTTAVDGGWSVQPLLHIGTYSVRFNASWIGFDWPWSASQNISLGLQAATSALLARMTVAPTTVRANLLNRLIVDLSVAGLWAKLDALYLLAAHDAQAARLNLIGSQFNLTAVNSPVFTADRGYAGTGGAMYLATGFSPAGASAPRYERDSAHISAWSLTNVQQTGGLIGNGVASGDAHIYPWSADAKIYTQVNSANSDSIVLASSSGGFIASRLSSTTQKTFKDGQLVATYSKASVAPSSNGFVIGAGGPSTGYTTRQIGAATIGSGLTDAEAATLHSVLRDYLTDINAVYSPETAALLARMTVTPSTARKQLIDALITALVAAGLWAKLDALYLLAAHDAQAARLNWIADRNNLTAVNSPTFTTDRGYAGTGAAMYLDTGFNPATAASPKYTQNSAHLSAWSLTNIQQTGGLIGNGVGSGDAHIYPYSADTRLYTQVNSATSDSVALTSSLGHFVASRLASDTHKAYREGGLVGTYTKASVAPASRNFVIGAGGAGTGYTSRRVALATIGAGLTDAEVASLRAAANTYLLALGAVA